MTLDKKEIGERIRKLRKERKLTQEELAEKVSYTSRSSIAQIEKGNMDISSKKLKSLAEALNTTVDYIMSGVTDEISWNYNPKHYEDMLKRVSLYAEHLLGMLETLPEERQKELVRYAEYLSDTTIKEENMLINGGE